MPNTHARIFENGTEIRIVRLNQAFRLGDTSYPREWFTRGGTLPAPYTFELFEQGPPAPPVPPTRWRLKLYEVLDRLNPAKQSSFMTWASNRPPVYLETLRARGIESDDSVVRAQIQALGEDPDVILARP